MKVDGTLEIVDGEQGWGGGGYGNMGMKMIKVYCTHLKCQNETLFLYSKC